MRSLRVGSPESEARQSFHNVYPSSHSGSADLAGCQVFSGIVIAAGAGFAILRRLEEKLIDLITAQVLFQLRFSFLKRFCG